MQKEKMFLQCRFPPNIFDEVFTIFNNIWNDMEIEESLQILSVETGDEKWQFDNIDEFISEYRNGEYNFHFRKEYYLKTKEGKNKYFKIDLLGMKNSYDLYNTSVKIEAENRITIEKFFHIFENAKEKGKIPNPPKEKKEINPVIFIGHGPDFSWRDLKDHLRDQHGYSIEAYETGSRAGHTIRDILENMARKSSFALLVMTADDVAAGHKHRARQNVVHETGLFQGRLGFDRAIVLLENGVEEFSNLHGIQQIRFDKGNIRATFGDILATLKREFGPNRTQS